MSKQTPVFAAIAIALTIATGTAYAQSPVRGAAAPVTISPEVLHLQIDAAKLPITIIDEPY